MELTPRCARALQLAQAAARKLGHRHLTGAHLLLGLGDVGRGAVQAFFQYEDIPREMLWEFLSRFPAAPAPALPDEAAVSALLTRAEQEAISCRATRLGTEHLFTAILADAESEAAGFLKALGIDRVAWLQEMRRELAGT